MMTGEELNNALKNMAVKNGLCEKWTNEWRDSFRIEEWLDMYVRGQDFCIKHDYPPVAFIKENFKREDLHKHRIFIDEEVMMNDAQHGFYIFLGHCTGSITFDDFAAATLYVRHTSDITVTAKGAARVFVSIHEKAECKTKVYQSAVVKRYDHTEEA